MSLTTSVAAPEAAIPGRMLRRRVQDWLAWSACAAAFLLLGGATLWILGTVLARGLSALSWDLIAHGTVGTGGGLLNAIEGTILLGLGGILLAIPPGLAAGVYLAEFDNGFFAPILRFFADVLVGVPSIVIGYFGYVTMVEILGWGFSIAAGSISLAIIALPYIARASEMAIRQVPRDLRDAARALGANDRRVILDICLPVAMPGILTGILLALAIAIGETAPLLYTAGWSNFLWSGKLTHEPVGYLTYAIWAFITEPFASAHALAYAAAFLVTMFALLVSIFSRLMLDQSARRGRRFQR